MRYFIFTIIISTFFSAGAQTPTGSLTGVVTSAAGVPLPAANVFIAGLNRGASADALGRYQMSDIPTGEHTLTISAIGYETRTEAITVRAGETNTYSASLKPGELMLADVVVTGQTGHDLNTVSQVDIRLRPINTSQDILRMVPGLFIAQHAGGGKAEQIFLRGFDIDHGTDINLSVDGLPINMVSHAHGQGYSDMHFIIPELVDYVDFNKGPYYADKGDFTTAGYAALHTRNTLDKNMVKVEGGRFGTFRNVNAIQLVDSKTGDRRDQAYVASEYFRSDGFFENKQNFKRLNLSGKYNSYFGDNKRLTIGLSTFTSSWDASGQIPDRAVASGLITRWGSLDNTEGGETSRTNAYIKYTNTTEDGSLFENQFYFSKYDFYLVSNFTFFLNDPVNGDQITQQESRTIYGYNGTFQRAGNLGSIGLQTSAGIGFRYDDVNDIRLSHTVARKTYLGDYSRGDIDQTNLFAYVSETLQLSPALSVTGALRFDQFNFSYADALTPGYTRQTVDKSTISPKLNITYAASRNVNLYVKSGVGFHSNDTRVVVAQSGKEVLPKAYGIDIGGTFKVADKLLINTAVWALDLQQEFVYVGDEAIVEPNGKTRRKGVDLSVRYQALDWLYLDTDVNLTDPRAKDVPEGQNHIPLAPTFTSIGGLSVKLPNGLSASLRYRYMGDRPANEDNSVVATGYFLMDAVVKYTRPAYELSFTSENILNREWKEAQFDTESRLQNEATPVSEIHFTPGTLFFFKAGISLFF